MVSQNKSFDNYVLNNSAEVKKAAISEWRPFLASRGIMKVSKDPNRS